MKKFTVLLALLATFIVMPLHAQFKFGIEGGLNLNKPNVENFKSQNATGWFVGPKAQFTIPVLGLGIDGAILYSQKNMNINLNDDLEGIAESASIDKKLSYIDIPINLKYNIGFSSLIGVYIATGPQYSWYIGDKNFGLNGDGESLGDIVAMNTSSFSWNVGVGINAFSHLQLGVTYNIPLGNTAEIDGLSTLKKMDVKNNNWQVRIAYMF